MPRTLRPEIALAITLAGCLPPDEPVKKPTPVDADLAELAHDWKVSGHVLAMKSSLTDGDANEHLGRIVAIKAASYTSPWHGTCDEASRERHKRSLVEVAADVDVAAAGREAAQRFGIGPDVAEYRLSCQGQARIPPMTIYITGTHAMTCFGGVCYLLSR